MTRRGVATLALTAACVLGPALASPARAEVVDRTVARFSDPEATDTSGAVRFVMMRELVVEAWLVAYERAPTGTPVVDDKALRLALERHVIEAVLGARVLPAAVEARLGKATVDANVAQTVAVGGDERMRELRVQATGSPEGGASELAAILRRRARAELYLEAAVAQPVEPNEIELRSAWVKAPGVYAKRPFDEVSGDVRAWLRTTRLRESAQAYYQAIRSKLRLEIVPEV